MPPPSSCTCGNCKKCAPRDYMRRYRDVVWPKLSEWERSIRNEVNQMTKYTCPLSVMAAANYYIETQADEQAEAARAAGIGMGA